MLFKRLFIHNEPDFEEKVSTLINDDQDGQIDYSRFVISTSETHTIWSEQ